MTRRRKGRIYFATIPDWAIGAGKDGPTLASAISLADLEERWIRLDAATQRKILGYPVFGKRAIYSNGTELRTSYSAAFGTDSVTEIWSWGAITKAARARKSLWHA